MRNRRDFLRNVAGATAGMFFGGRGLADAGFLSFQSGPAGRRREVLVGGRRVKVIDGHAHCMIREVLPVVKGHTDLETYLSTRTDSFLGPERLQIMDEQGIDMQALSINEFWYGTDRNLAREIIKVQNETLAQWCAARPDRFVGLASVALQHPDLAAEQLEEGVKKLGLRGAGIAGSVEGEELSARKFDPFWAKAAELGVLLFMHPQAAPYTTENPRLGKGGSGNPLETTVAASHLIFDGTLDRFPGLKICLAHAGGFLPSYSGRAEAGCLRAAEKGKRKAMGVVFDENCGIKKRPIEYFRKELLVDTMIFREEGLRQLVAECGAGQIVYGTDIPFDWPVGVDFVLNAAFLSDAEKEAILGGNLIKLLRIAT